MSVPMFPTITRREIDHLNVLSGRRYLRSPPEGSEIASTSSPVFFSFSLRAMSAWATMPTSLPFSTTGSRRTMRTARVLPFALR